MCVQCKRRRVALPMCGAGWQRSRVNPRAPAPGTARRAWPRARWPTRRRTRSAAPAPARAPAPPPAAAAPPAARETVLSLCLPQEGIKGSAWLPVSGRCADVAALARRGGARLGRARQPRRKRDEAAARGARAPAAATASARASARSGALSATCRASAATASALSALRLRRAHREPYL